MPADRLIHPKLGHSAKVSNLTDFEFRVWMQYILSADDFGVMRASAVTLQADNDALNNKPRKVVQRALDRLVKIGLIRTFDHQTRTYVYQHDWQDWQKIEYPRATIEPKPTAAALSTCDPSTVELFGKHPGGVRQRKPKDVPNVSQINPKDVPTTRAQTRETANANGSRLSSELEGNRIVTPELADRAAALLEKYAELYTKHRHGARLARLKPSIDWDKACELCRTWSDDRLEKMAVICLTTDDDWISRTDRGFAVFVARATWCDERLSVWEAQQRRA